MEHSDILLTLLILYLIYFIKINQSYEDLLLTTIASSFNYQLFLNNPTNMRCSPKTIYANAILDDENILFLEQLLEKNFAETNKICFSSTSDKIFLPIFNNLLYQSEYDKNFIKINNKYLYDVFIDKLKFIFIDDETYSIMKTNLFGFLFYFALLNSITIDILDYSYFINLTSKEIFNDRLRKILKMEKIDNLNNKLSFILSLDQLKF